MDFKRELLLKVLDEAFHPLRQVFVRGVGDLQIEGGQMPVRKQLNQPPGIDVTRRHPFRQNRESSPFNGGLTQSGDGIQQHGGQELELFDLLGPLQIDPVS